jgi:hypothetical protein
MTKKRKWHLDKFWLKCISFPIVFYFPEKAGISCKNIAENMESKLMLIHLKYNSGAIIFKVRAGFLSSGTAAERAFALKIIKLMPGVLVDASHITISKAHKMHQFGAL